MSKTPALALVLLSLAVGGVPAHASSTTAARGVTAGDDDARLARKKTKKELRAEEEAAARAAAEEEARVQAEEQAKKEAEEAETARLAEEDKQRQAAADEAARRAAAAKSSVVEAQGLDARVRRLSDELARAIKRLPGDHRDQSFAVVPFGENDEESKSRRLGLVVSDLVLTNLARDHRINLVERGRVGAVLQEQSFQATGAVDPDQAAAVGKLLGARGLVVGEVTDTKDAFRISARVLDMETAAVLGAAESTLPKEELIAFSADAVVLRSKSAAFFRSAVAPGWGQLYNREPVKAGIVGGTVGVLALSTGVLATTALLTHNAYTTFTPEKLPPGTSATRDNVSSTVVGLRESANVQYTVAGVLLGLTATAWLVGALDAYISGVDVDTLDEALATN